MGGSGRKEWFQLFLIMVLVTFLVAGVVVYFLYRTEFDQSLDRLRNLAESQARLIESIAAFNELENKDYPGGGYAATLNQVLEASAQFNRGQNSVEIQLARKEDNRIIFEVQYGKSAGEIKPIELPSPFAEAMQRAVKGEKGVLVGRDYSGTTVMAAYEPVKVVNLGLVAKMDLDELQEPFVTSLWIALSLGAILVLMATLAFIRISRSLRREMEEKDERLNAVINNEFTVTIVIDIHGTIRMFNPAAEKTFGWEAAEILGRNVNLLMPEPHRSAHDQYLRRYLETGRGKAIGVRNELPASRKDGSGFFIELIVADMKWRNERVFLATIRDITAEKRHREETGLLTARLQKSEERQQLMMLGSSDGFWDWLDVSKDEIWMSPKSYNLMGYEDNEITVGINRIKEELLHPEDMKRAFDALDMHFKERTPYDSMFRLRTKSGQYRWFRARGSSTFSAEGKPLRMSGALTDIHDRVLAEQELDRHRAELESLVERRTEELSQAIRQLRSEARQRKKTEDYLKRTEDYSLVMRVLVGLDGRWLEVPRMLCTLLGYSKEELLSKTFMEVTHPEDADENWVQCQRVIRGEINSFDLRKRYVTKEGKIVWVDLNSTIVRDDQGMPLYFVAYIRDISQIKEVERQKEELEALKNDFLSMAAHELRTPLTPIRGFAELLATRNNLSQEQIQKFAHHISKESAALADLIGDLLDVSRIESGQGYELEKTRCDFLDLVRSEIGFFSGANKERQFDLSVEGNNEPVFLDREKMRQVLRNVISNSIKYSPNGAPVSIRVEFQPGGVACRVADTGIGMTPEQMSHVFEKFYRADKSGKVPGTGLGMVIVKTIVEMHGGAVSLKSRLGEGTTVELRLPGDGKRV